ncbi:uncharacterized protein LOC144742629 isoform X2 [Ciona intestinalis]
MFPKGKRDKTSRHDEGGLDHHEVRIGKHEAHVSFIWNITSGKRTNTTHPNCWSRMLQLRSVRTHPKILPKLTTKGCIRQDEIFVLTPQEMRYEPKEQETKKRSNLMSTPKSSVPLLSKPYIPECHEVCVTEKVEVPAFTEVIVRALFSRHGVNNELTPEFPAFVERNEQFCSRFGLLTANGITTVKNNEVHVKLANFTNDHVCIPNGVRIASIVPISAYGDVSDCPPSTCVVLGCNKRETAYERNAPRRSVASVSRKLLNQSAVTKK